MQETFSYDDVLLAPQYSDIKSRSEVSISTDLGNNVTLKLPVIASPMDTITEAAMAIAIGISGGTSVIHRYNSIEMQSRFVSMAQDMFRCRSRPSHNDEGGPSKPEGRIRLGYPSDGRQCSHFARGQRSC